LRIKSVVFLFSKSTKKVKPSKAKLLIGFQFAKNDILFKYRLDSYTFHRFYGHIAA